MTKEETVQGIGPEIADGLQKVLILFKRGKGERQSIGYPWIPIKASRCSPLCYTKLPSPLEDLAKHEGYQTKSLDLCLDSRRGFD
jgi:hypothetical protein